MQYQFEGFSEDTLKFLRDLKVNNNKAWFESNRLDYQNFLLEPFRHLAGEMGEFMLTIDPYLEVSPKINKTISRIHRDTRFSKDKSPYKTTMWITFKRLIKYCRDAPAYFFEITEESYRYGMGFYAASKETMDKFREGLDRDPGIFIEAISFYLEEQIFTLEGDKYKRMLYEDKPEELRDWYQRKNFYLVCNSPTYDRLFGRGDDLVFGFNLVTPLYKYLLGVKVGTIR